MILVRPARRRLGLLTRALGALLALVAVTFGILWWTLPSPAEWSTRNPTTTALIEQRRAEAAAKGRAYQPDQRWLPLPRVSRRLAEAVVASEDAKFWGHGGFDWDALEVAARDNLKQRRFARGASTITQQVAKNLWFGTEKSLVRKAREAMQAARLERKLGKGRILELYLNIAEWGDGIFGIEAAARHHLGTGAADLTTAQAVLLASMLPAPRRADLSRPAPWLVARARGLLDRLYFEKALTDTEHEAAALELSRILGLSPAEASIFGAKGGSAKNPMSGSGGESLESAPLPEPPADDAPESTGPVAPVSLPEGPAPAPPPQPSATPPLPPQTETASPPAPEPPPPGPPAPAAPPPEAR